MDCAAGPRKSGTAGKSLPPHSGARRPADSGSDYGPPHSPIPHITLQLTEHTGARFGHQLRISVDCRDNSGVDIHEVLESPGGV